jgi:hypothetical protein
VEAVDKAGWGDREGFDPRTPEELTIEEAAYLDDHGDEQRDKAYNDGYRQGLCDKPCIDRLDLDYLEGWRDGFDENRKAGG